MTAAGTLARYGELIEPATLRIERLLPGPVERIWAYLTDSDLRRQWLAAGEMVLAPGAPFELVWRNDELGDTPGEPPEGMGGEHRMTSRIVAVDPPRKLVFAWAPAGEVTITLEPRGEDVLLTVVHDRLDDRNERVGVAAGWHAHLDILADRAAGRNPASFWDGWSRLRKVYQQRLPA